MTNAQEGFWMEKDWREWEENELREELDRSGPFVSNDRLAEILSRSFRASSTPLYNYSAGVLAARTVLQLQGKNYANK